MTIDASATSTSSRRLRLGMVGGGPGGFIGAVHRIAARIDDRWELVAAALSSNPERGRAAARDLHIAEDRAYGNFAWRKSCGNAGHVQRVGDDQSIEAHFLS